jgi:hypothetical protein
MTQMQKLLHKSFLTLDGITRQVVRPEHSMPVARPARFLSFRAAQTNASA